MSLTRGAVWASLSGLSLWVGMLQGKVSRQKFFFAFRAARGSARSSTIHSTRNESVENIHTSARQARHAQVRAGKEVVGDVLPQCHPKAYSEGAGQPRGKGLFRQMGA